MSKARKLLLLPLVAITIVAVILLLITTFILPGLVPAKPTVSGDKYLSIETRVALAASLGGTFGNGEPLPQQIEPILSRGGLPIVSVTYADPANVNDDALTVLFDGIPDLHIPKSEFSFKPGETTIADLEARLNSTIQKFLEIRAPLSSFPEDDSVRKGVLLAHERIARFQEKDIGGVQEEVKDKDYLVIALGYGAIHIYSLTPLNFVTQFNGLDAGQITGEWWQ
jgi:hypothetical protein